MEEKQTEKMKLRDIQFLNLKVDYLQKRRRGEVVYIYGWRDAEILREDFEVLLRRGSMDDKWGRGLEVVE